MSKACGILSAGTGGLVVGRNCLTAFLGCSILEVGTAAIALTDAQFNIVFNNVKARYGP